MRNDNLIGQPARSLESLRDSMRWCSRGHCSVSTCCCLPESSQAVAPTERAPSIPAHGRFSRLERGLNGNGVPVLGACSRHRDPGPQSAPVRLATCSRSVRPILDRSASNVYSLLRMYTNGVFDIAAVCLAENGRHFALFALPLLMFEAS